MMKSMSSVAVVVSNGKKAMRWYNEKLGFRIVDREGHWITVMPKGSKTLLHLCEASKSKLERGNTGISFAVDDLDKTYEQMSRKGIKFTQKPVDKGWGKFAMFSDPDGNVFWLV
jgi:predicted enzyme related to lactoylglutathione lyase